MTSPICSTKTLNHHLCTSGRWPQVFQELHKPKVSALRNHHIQMQMGLARLLLESVPSLLPNHPANRQQGWAH
jgi:hypothetical protein